MPAHTELMPVPPMGAIMSYRGVYALCTTASDGRLKATHMAHCLIGGPTPMWGVWTVAGRFQRFFTFRHEIERTYSKLVWRRWVGTWNLTNVSDKSAAERREELRRIYHRGVTGIHEPVAALLSDGTVEAWKPAHQGVATPLYTAPQEQSNVIQLPLRRKA
jgi:hypothetical protein